MIKTKQKSPRSVRSYQNEIRKLKELICGIQWVQPTYNGSHSCSCCGEQKHIGCNKDCAVAKITDDYGRDHG